MIIRAIISEASRLSTCGRMLKEQELAKLPLEQQRVLLNVLRDARHEIDSERRTFRPFPGGPRIRM